MNHDTNTADIAETAALVAEQRHRLETWPELVAALEALLAEIYHPSGIELSNLYVAAEQAVTVLKQATSRPAPEDRRQLYPPSVDRRSVEDLYE